MKLNKQKKREFLRAVLAGDQKAIKKYISKAPAIFKYENEHYYKHNGSSWQAVTDPELNETDMLFCHDNEEPKDIRCMVIGIASLESMRAYLESCGCTPVEITQRLASHASLDDHAVEVIRAMQITI